MNTPAHLIFGLAAFGKVDAPKVTAAAFAGVLVPICRCTCWLARIC
jgi:hypothetical protein